MEGYSYTFISRTEVSADSNSGSQVLTNIGIVCLLIALMCEFMINNIYALVLVVPLIYLVHLRRQMSGRRHLMDVYTRLTLFPDRAEVTYHGGYLTGKGTLTKQYIIPREGVRQLKCVPEERTLSLIFDGKINLFTPEGVLLRSRWVSREPLELSLPPEAFSTVVDHLGR